MTTKIKQDKMNINEAIDKVCKHLPEQYELILLMENGAAWLEMYDHSSEAGQAGFNIDLGDPTDKTLAEQLNDALCIANGWDI